MLIILNLQSDTPCSLPVTSWGVDGSSSQALNSTDLLSEWQTQQMLTLSNTQWLLSPPAFALLWFLDEVSCLATWLWRTVLFVCYVTNRCASGVPYQPGLMLTSIPSTRCISLSCCRLLIEPSSVLGERINNHYRTVLHSSDKYKNMNH